MKREFIWTERFMKGWKECGLEDDNLRQLEEILLADPKVGAVIIDTNGARKVRFAFEDRGKRGSGRVIYVDLEISERIVALDAFQKNKKKDLTLSDKKVIRNMVTDARNQYGKKG